MPDDPRPSAGARLAWSASLLGSAGILLAAGRGLTAPRSLAPGSVGDWLATTDPILVVMSAVRAVALVAVGYLILLTAIGWIARRARWSWLGRLATTATLPAFRRMVGGVAGVTLSLAPLTGTALAGSAPPVTVEEHPGTVETLPGAETTTAADEPVIMRALDDEPADPAPAGPDADPPAQAVMRLIADSPTPADPPPTAPAITPTPPSAAPHTPTTTVPPAPPATSQAGGSRTIAPGDHLWNVSHQTLEAALHRAPSDEEVLGYLNRIVELNRDVLVVPEDPDLVYPGQVFTMPAVDA